MFPFITLNISPIPFWLVEFQLRNQLITIWELPLHVILSFLLLISPAFYLFSPLIFFNLAAPLKCTLFIVVFLFWTDIFSLPPTSWEAIIFSYTQENYKQLTSVPTSHTATYQFCFLPMINSLSLSDSQSQHKDSIIWVFFSFFFFFAHCHIFKYENIWTLPGVKQEKPESSNIYDILMAISMALRASGPQVFVFINYNSK